MDFKKYRFKKFKPYLKDIKRTDCSCGGHLCSIITGISLDLVKILHPRNDDWSEAWVKTFISLAGYHLTSLPKNFYEIRRGFEPIILRDHLIVLLLGIDKRELTWACVYNNKCYHGQDMFKGLSGFDVLLNCPIHRMWLCYPM